MLRQDISSLSMNRLTEVTKVVSEERWNVDFEPGFLKKVESPGALVQCLKSGCQTSSFASLNWYEFYGPIVIGKRHLKE